MKATLAGFLQRTDAFSARLNHGLAAVAIALALIATAALIERLPARLSQLQAGSGDLALGDLQTGTAP